MHNNNYPLFLTSIPPKEIEKHKKTISSWKMFTSQIISLNRASEIEILEPFFPNVLFFKIDEKSSIHSKLIDINHFINFIKNNPNKYFAIINADIEFGQYPLQDWNKILYYLNYYDLIISNRKNYEYSYHDSELYYYGFDFFLFKKDLVNIIPYNEFALGTVVWDYLFPVFTIFNNHKLLYLTELPIYHKKYKDNWVLNDLIIYNYYFYNLLKKHFNLPNQIELFHYIINQTIFKTDYFVFKLFNAFYLKTIYANCNFISHNTSNILAYINNKLNESLLIGTQIDNRLLQDTINFLINIDIIKW